MVVSEPGQGGKTEAAGRWMLLVIQVEELKFLNWRRLLDKRWNIFQKLKEGQVNFPKTEFWSSSCRTVIKPRTEALRSVSLSSCVPDRNYLFLICYPDLNLTTLRELEDQRQGDGWEDERGKIKKEERAIHSSQFLFDHPTHTHPLKQKFDECRVNLMEWIICQKMTYSLRGQHMGLQFERP